MTGRLQFPTARTWRVRRATAPGAFVPETSTSADTTVPDRQDAVGTRAMKNRCSPLAKRAPRGWEKGFSASAAVISAPPGSAAELAGVDVDYTPVDRPLRDSRYGNRRSDPLLPIAVEGELDPKQLLGVR